MEPDHRRLRKKKPVLFERATTLTYQTLTNPLARVLTN
jgi:hypothetical protein